jgi:hypothetical protein
MAMSDAVVAVRRRAAIPKEETEVFIGTSIADGLCPGSIME